MPQHQSAIKRLRQNRKRREHNKKRLSKMRTLINKVMEAEDKETAEEHLKDAVSYVDRLAVKDLIHPNKAARKKSQMTTHVNSL